MSVISKRVMTAALDITALMFRLKGFEMRRVDGVLCLRMSGLSFRVSDVKLSTSCELFRAWKITFGLLYICPSSNYIMEDVYFFLNVK